MRRLRNASLAAVAACVVAGPSVAGEWLAGDLHVHTIYSHDSWGPPDDDNTGPDEPWVLGHTVERQFLIAASRGLDFLAITDHNDVRSQSDPGFGEFGVIAIPGYENSLRGHAQMLGAETIYDKGDSSAGAVRALRDALRADGGVFQINHPAGESTSFPVDADWSYARCPETDPGCDAYPRDVVPDVVEVWNIQWLWQPPFPSSNSIDDAVRYWQGWLDRGERVGATAGSDNHWVTTTAIQGAGQPTTWVYANDRSRSAILAGLAAGRTYISWQPPALGGPALILEADTDGDGAPDALVGDAIAAESTIRARVSGAPPGSRLRLVTNGGAVLAAPVVLPVPEWTHEVRMPSGSTWVRAELLIDDFPEARATLCDEPLGGETTYCRNRLAVLALSSALYVAPAR